MRLIKRFLKVSIKCNNANASLLVFFAGFLSCIASFAQPNHTSATFAELPPSAIGAANLVHPYGGTYVYGPEARDQRVPMKAIPIGAFERRSYSFFSAQEEQALLALYQKQANDALVQQENVRHKSRSSAHPSPMKRRGFSTAGLNWPKVVVREGSICVPSLAQSESTDWKNFLVCWDGDKK